MTADDLLACVRTMKPSQKVMLCELLMPYFPPPRVIEPAPPGVEPGLLEELLAMARDTGTPVLLAAGPEFTALAPEDLVAEARDVAASLRQHVPGRQFGLLATLGRENPRFRDLVVAALRQASADQAFPEVPGGPPADPGLAAFHTGLADLKVLFGEDRTVDVAQRLAEDILWMRPAAQLEAVESLRKVSPGLCDEVSSRLTDTIQIRQSRLQQALDSGAVSGSICHWGSASEQADFDRADAALAPELFYRVERGDIPRPRYELEALPPPIRAAFDRDPVEGLRLLANSPIQAINPYRGVTVAGVTLCVARWRSYYQARFEGRSRDAVAHRRRDAVDPRQPCGAAQEPDLSEYVVAEGSPLPFPAMPSDAYVAAFGAEALEKHREEKAITATPAADAAARSEQPADAENIATVWGFLKKEYAAEAAAKDKASTCADAIEEIFGRAYRAERRHAAAAYHGRQRAAAPPADVPAVRPAIEPEPWTTSGWAVGVEAARTRAQLAPGHRVVLSEDEFLKVQDRWEADNAPGTPGRPASPEGIVHEERAVGLLGVIVPSREGESVLVIVDRAAVAPA